MVSLKSIHILTDFYVSLFIVLFVCLTDCSSCSSMQTFDKAPFGTTSA